MSLSYAVTKGSDISSVVTTKESAVNFMGTNHIPNSMSMLAAPNNATTAKTVVTPENKCVKSCVMHPNWGDEWCIASC